MTPDSQAFLELSNLVAQNGIRYFVEPQANRSLVGLDLAARLSLTAYVCESDGNFSPVSARAFPDAEIYEGGPLTFLREVLPKLEGPAYFWLDPNSPTHAEEVALIEEAAIGKEWFLDLKAG